MTISTNTRCWICWIRWPQIVDHHDPGRALDIAREGLAFTRTHRQPFWETNIAPLTAQLEASHGDLAQACDLFDTTIDSHQQAGNTTWLTFTLFALAELYERIDQPEIAATLCGPISNQAVITTIADLADVVERLRNTLGTETFDRCIATGAAMDTAEAVRYAHHHINNTRQHQP